MTEAEEPSVSTSRRGWVIAGVIVGGVVILDGLMWLLLRSQGWVVGGDSPTYVLAAFSLAHLHLDPVPAISTDIVRHAVLAWPPGVTATAVGHVYLGPHGIVFAQGLGVPLLLAPFALVANEPGALVGFFAVIAAAWTFAAVRLAALLGLSPRGRLLLAISMVAPASIMAATQIYPDPLAGAFLVVAFVEVMRIERLKTFSSTSCVAIAVALVWLPWFQVKNAVPVVIVLAALVVCSARTKTWKPTLIVAGVAVTSLVALVAYNEYYFGDLVGLPEATPAFHAREIGNILALAFDRHHGFLVQVPTTGLGLIGFWLARRKVPISIVATLLAVGAIVVINGSQPTANFMGGTTLVGRFEWTVVPLMVVGVAFLAKALEDRRRLIGGLVAAIAGLWVIEVGLVVDARHVLQNSIISPFAPFDPALYPGWWGWFDHYLPSFLIVGELRAWVPQLVVELAIFGVAAVLLVGAARAGDAAAPRPAWRRRVTLGTLAVVALAAASVGPGTLAAGGPVPITEARLGGPWKTGATAMSFPPAAVLTLGSGRYSVTMTYQFTSSTPKPAVLAADVHSPARIIVADWLSFRHPTDAALMQLRIPEFTKAQQSEKGSVALEATPTSTGAAEIRTASFTFRVDTTDYLSFQLDLAAHSTLKLDSLDVTLDT